MSANLHRRRVIAPAYAVIGLACACVACGGDDTGTSTADGGELAPTPDCRNAGNECAEGFLCKPIYSTERYTCNPSNATGPCPPGYCENNLGCRPSEGGTLCNGSNECCNGVACVDGRCETR